jgi:hypothetical protein
MLRRLLLVLMSSRRLIVLCQMVRCGHTALQLQGLEFFVFGFDSCILFLDCSFQLIHLFLSLASLTTPCL